MQKSETRMIGGEAKVLWDKCDFTGNTIRVVKNHWTKKHRRQPQEGEEAMVKGRQVKPVETKKLRADLEKTKKN